MTSIMDPYPGAKRGIEELMKEKKGPAKK